MPEELPASLRVLMIAPTSFFADYGCHVRILEEARALQNLGHSVTIATYHNGAPVDGLDIKRSLPVPWRANFEVGSSRHKIGYDVLLAARVFGLLARGHFDIVHSHLHEGALLALVIGRMFGVPFVFDFQGSMTREMLDHGFVKKGSRGYQLFEWIERTVNHRSPLILTSSVHAERLLIEEFGCCSERVHALPDAVNTDVFLPVEHYNFAWRAARRAELGIPPQRKVVVYLGLLAEYQGTGLLLKAMEKVIAKGIDAHLLLMGFPNLELYRDQCRELGITDRVTFTGRVPYAHAPEQLVLGDVAVSAKLSMTEGAGKLLNYMAVGLPTVAFDTPVAREFLGTEGSFAAPGDPASLAECLAAALCPASEAEALAHQRAGQKLRQRAVQHFSWSKVGVQLAEYYRALLGSTRPALLSSE